jgi:DNA ligase (NAD+)
MNLPKLQSLPIDKLIEYYETENTQTLLKLKQQLDDLYYNDETEFDDFRYDYLKDTIEKRVGQSETVGAPIRVGEKKKVLPFWLGSMNKITTEAELDKWTEKYTSEKNCLTYKLDGVSCLLEFNGADTFLYTRGNGLVGSDISHIIKYINLPVLSSPVFVRGELIFSKKNFEKYKTEFKNARNAVSGLIGGKKYKDALKDIEFITYEIVEDNSSGIVKSLKTLKKLGFKVVDYLLLSNLSIDYLSNLFLQQRIDYPYNIDGLVIQTADKYDRNTNGNPEYAFAFKMLFETDIHQTVVEKVEWNVSKWGRLKPIVIIKPVSMADGVVLSKATAHNAKYVVDNAIRKGTIVKITRSKDVIPYILEVVNLEEGEPDMPESYTWDKNKVNIIATEDEGICVKVITNFFSQLSIKYVSIATVNNLYSNGFDSLMKIIKADQADFIIPGIKERGAERIYTNIHARLADVSLAELLSASSVLGYGIGLKRIESLLQDIPNLLEIKSKKNLYEKILGVDGFSDILANTVIDNIEVAREFIAEISPYITYRKVKKTSTDLKNMKVVFTGFRDKELEALITEKGGKVVGSVSKNTTHVIVKNNKDEGGSKLEKAKELGIQILTRDELIKLI